MNALTLDHDREPSELLIDTSSVTAMPWRDLPGQPGVEEKLFVSDPLTGSSAGLLRLAPGAGLRRHLHTGSAHHVMVVQGTCTVGTRLLRQGSYTFALPGSVHEIDEAGPAGCLLFFVTLPG